MYYSWNSGGYSNWQTVLTRKVSRDVALTTLLPLFPTATLNFTHNKVTAAVEELQLYCPHSEF